MSSSRRDGATVVVTTGEDAGLRFVVVDEVEIGFEARDGRVPSEGEAQEGSKHFFVGTAELNRERRERREREQGEA